jgi:uncharacterized protein (DUF2345 family)
VRIRYHWQDNGDATCGVRVVQRSAGGGMGSQFLPRIGQEVLVQFIENDIDRPIIIGALYNGQGEGGVTPTPGGGGSADDTASRFQPAADHAVSAQGNVAGGNSPLWHGASSDSAGHRNAAAQWGVRSKEFGGSGYNQLLFDDTDAQGRVQLRSTHAASELSLGHLIHSADNYRGSLRGHGAELRTDAYGAVRGGAGLLITSYKLNHSAMARDPVGDNAAGIALLKQAVKLGETFNDAAKTHETVTLAGHLGAAKANASVLDDKTAPLQAMLTAVSGMVGNGSLDAARADADEKKTEPGDKQVPHVSSPIIAVSGKSGIGVTAGAAMQLANGETISLMSGQDSQFITGGQLRAHSGQAIGVLGGAVKPGEGGLSMQLIAAKDAIDIQAQADELKVQARDDINIVSTNAEVDWAAAKRISLSTAGGANITIEGGNITVQCPGKLTIHAGKKDFSGPKNLSFPIPTMPVNLRTKNLPQFALKFQDIPGAYGVVPENQEWKIVQLDALAAAENFDGQISPLVFGKQHWDNVICEGVVATNGDVPLSEDQQAIVFAKIIENPQRIWMISGLTAMRLEVSSWSSSERVPNTKRILDALNFVPDGRSMNATQEALFSEIAKADAKIASVVELNNQTLI